MGIEKIIFKIEEVEEYKPGKWLILLLIAIFVTITTITATTYSSDAEDNNSQEVASQWARAVVESNASLMYLLMPVNKRDEVIEELAKFKNIHFDTSKYEDFDITRWEKDDDTYVYRFHYTNPDICSGCQKDIWVKVTESSEGWVVPDYNFTEREATSVIRKSAGEKTFSTEDLNNGDEETRNRNFIDYLLDLF